MLMKTKAVALFLLQYLTQGSRTCLQHYPFSLLHELEVVTCFNLDFTNYINVCQCSSSVKFMKYGYVRAIFKCFSILYILYGLLCFLE